jgi:hypothetical protein
LFTFRPNILKEPVYDTQTASAQRVHTPVSYSRAAPNTRNPFTLFSAEESQAHALPHSSSPSPFSASASTFTAAPSPVSSLTAHFAGQQSASASPSALSHTATAGATGSSTTVPLIPGPPPTSQPPPPTTSTTPLTTAQHLSAAENIHNNQSHIKSKYTPPTSSPHNREQPTATPAPRMGVEPPANAITALVPVPEPAASASASAAYAAAVAMQSDLSSAPFESVSLR